MWRVQLVLGFTAGTGAFPHCFTLGHCALPHAALPIPMSRLLGHPSCPLELARTFRANVWSARLPLSAPGLVWWMPGQATRTGQVTQVGLT